MDICLNNEKIINGLIEIAESIDTVDLNVQGKSAEEVIGVIKKFLKLKYRHKELIENRLYWFNGKWIKLESYNFLLNLKRIFEEEKHEGVSSYDPETMINQVVSEGLEMENGYITGINLFGGNCNGVYGIKKLLPILKNTKVTHLNLTLNKIRDEGAKLLAKELKNTNLNYLALYDNLIFDEGKKYLAEAQEELRKAGRNVTIQY